jgi:putative membrane protein
MHGFYGGLTRGGYALGFPWGGLVMAIVMLAIIALVIVLLIRAGKAIKSGAKSVGERGLEILIERFARGEIDAETFQKMKEEIEK